MKNEKPATRTEASKSAATRHLDAGQKKALDVQAGAEHTDGPEHERLTRKITKLGDSAKTAAN